MVLDALEDRGLPQDPEIRSWAEDAKLRTADRLANLVSVSWRVLWLTMLSRTSTDAPSTVALTDEEIVILDRASW